MLNHRILPCLDVRNGRVVKGVQFQGLRDAGDPVACAQRYQQQGADELVLLDVAATPDGRRTALETVAAVRRVLRIPLTVGGGVREVEDAAQLLQAGADKVGVNSAAVRRPQLLEELACRFGSQCVVLAIDARQRNHRGGWEIVVRSGRDAVDRDAVAWAKQGEALGAGEILLTSWDRDGTGQGYDLELLRQVATAVRLPLIASGGGAEARHLAEAFSTGASAALVASILHDGVTEVRDLKNQLRGQGLRLRP